MKRFKQTGIQVVHHLLACHLLHNRREHVGAQAVVEIECAGLMNDGVRQESRHPVLLGLSVAPRRLHVVSARHRQQVAHGHLLQILAHLCGQLIREEIDHLIHQRHLAFGNGEAHSSGGEGLADGMEHMGHSIHTLALPAAVDDIAVADNHHTVDVHRVLLCLPEEGIHRLSHTVRSFSTRQIDYLCRFFHVVFASRQCHQHHNGQNS